MTDSLNSVTQETYDQAEAVVIELLRAAYPSMDLRRGTVLRELLIRPAAAFYALQEERGEKLQATRSLETIAANPDLATAEDVNHILANYNISARTGAKAYGMARISLAYNQSYFLDPNFTLVTLEGLVFEVAQAYTISPTPTSGQLRLYTSADGTSYYCLLPVIAAEVGAEYEISAGTTLNTQVTFSGFITAEAQNNFTGGADAETVEELIARLPAAISHRSLESELSIESILRSAEHGNFDDVLQAISMQGYGDDAQLRDKHNPQGVAMGGKVDIYARTFNGPVITVLQKTGTLVSPNTYQFTITADEAPGYYAIRAIADADKASIATGASTALPILGSYPFIEVRAPVGLQGTIHDIDPLNGVIETAYTMYQQATITVTDVADAESATKEFAVELYTPPRLADIQAYVDNRTVRNLKADYLVRCPLICLVNIRARVVRKSSVVLDIAAMQQAVADYINGRSFVNELTESEIAAVLHRFDILRVDTSDDPLSGLELLGILRDAAGALHTLEGHSLNIHAIEDPDVLMTPRTCVFAANINDITITDVSESA